MDEINWALSKCFSPYCPLASSMLPVWMPRNPRDRIEGWGSDGFSRWLLVGLMHDACDVMGAKQLYVRYCALYRFQHINIEVYIIGTLHCNNRLVVSHFFKTISPEPYSFHKTLTSPLSITLMPNKPNPNSQKVVVWEMDLEEWDSTIRTILCSSTSTLLVTVSLSARITNKFTIHSKWEYPISYILYCYTIFTTAVIFAAGKCFSFVMFRILRFSK